MYYLVKKWAIQLTAADRLILWSSLWINHWLTILINNNWWKKSIENKARSQQKCNFFQNAFSLDKISIEIINTVKCSALNIVHMVSKVMVSMPSLQRIYPYEFICICCSDCRCRAYILCQCYNFWSTGYPIIVVLLLIIIWDVVQFRHSGLAGRQPGSLWWQFRLKTDIEILKQYM